MSNHGATYVGTSGWHYRHWKGPFYPQDLPAASFLTHYAQRLASAEINASFYKLPSTETLRSWRDAVPEGFVFAVNASRYLTHMKKLKDPREPLDTLYARLEALGAMLGPILFQLPPRWRCNAERLRDFLSHLNRAHRHAFEFRDRSWFDASIYNALKEHGAALCIYDLAGEEGVGSAIADHYC